MADGWSASAATRCGLAGRRVQHLWHSTRLGVMGQSVACVEKGAPCLADVSASEEGAGHERVGGIDGREGGRVKREEPTAKCGGEGSRTQGTVAGVTAFGCRSHSECCVVEERVRSGERRVHGGAAAVCPYGICQDGPWSQVLE